ncbi:serine/threonine-protein kinase [Streptomyces sp. KMM 9044]|uniref:serine/threonine-protein kinase n=1 Tax=Streptomyces sp. KMM 9044 TaxID=2744474 RepID=UPI00215105AC|nr:serine/threonine-protein kinase [Streptomyces sp. KMM 9044]WAX78413.1 serine/threonine-protein kinase [Streptomyces sp. KMM 9044]
MSEPEQAGTTRQDESARLLAGRYRLGDVLGRGGMGTVWRAEDETLGRTVAVKELRFPSSIDEEEKRRLVTRTLREAKAIARIRNSSAVTVFDVVQEDDRPWIVMELVEGKSLAEAIREDGLLEPRRAAEVGLAVLDVLRSAHREGILHRDVKPSNVLIAEDGRVVLTDFGIAQVEGDPSITSTGMLVGAPSYISPERARGHKPGPAADLWSLGGLLYAAVEGTPPYDKGSAIATLTAVMTEPLEGPRNAGPLRDVIHGLLTKDPAQRLDDATSRAMLNAVINAPETKGADSEPADATKVVPLPEQPGGRAGGGRGGGEAGERLRGAMRSVRKTAVSAGAAGSAAATRAKSVDRAGGSTAGKTAAANPADPATTPTTTRSGTGAGKGTGTGVRQGGPAANRGSGSVRGSASGAADAASGARDSGWPVMTPPDLPARPAPRASLTDMVPRRTLALIAVVVVLAVIGTVLALTLGGDDESGAGAKDGPDQVASGQVPSAETKKDGGSEAGADDGIRTDGEAAESEDTGTGTGSGDADAGTETGGSGADGSAGTDGDALVAATHNGTQGYTIGLPEGWKYRSTDGAGDRYTGPDGQKLLIAWTSTPKDDPVADWENQERGMVRSQYKRVRIEAVDYRGWNTADWEFTYVDGGTKYRTIDRGFVVDGRVGYALMYTAKADGWGGEQRKETWKALTRSFEPQS